MREYSIAAHRHLAEVASKAKAAVFIGYSFRDNDINNILSTIKDSIPKFIINKDSKAINSIPFADKTYRYNGTGLSDESMVKCLNYIDGAIK